MSSSRNNSLPPNSPLDLDKWQKPSKVARRHSPGVDAGDSGDEAAIAGSGFAALDPLGKNMDLGLDNEAGPRDAYMADPSATSLKRARSPPKSPSSSSPGHTLTRTSSTPNSTASNQVSSSPCTTGGWGEGVFISSTPSFPIWILLICFGGPVEAKFGTL